MYDAIVHPTDGSECADSALDHAISLADQYDTALHLTYVVQDSAVPPTPSPKRILEEMEKTGNRILDRREDQAIEAGIESVSSDVLHGHPHHRIVDLTEETDSDLIVMGTHGRSGLEHYVLGSVAEKTLRTAHVPVMAVESVDADG